MMMSCKREDIRNYSSAGMEGEIIESFRQANTKGIACDLRSRLFYAIIKKRVSDMYSGYYYYARKAADNA
jgi:hypothetical protein